MIIYLNLHIHYIYILYDISISVCSSVSCLLSVVSQSTVPMKFVGQVEEAAHHATDLEYQPNLTLTLINHAAWRREKYTKYTVYALDLKMATQPTQLDRPW